MKALTKLYPGAHYSNRNLIDFLQVVFDIIFGHPVQKYTKEREKHWINALIGNINMSPRSQELQLPSKKLMFHYIYHQRSVLKTANI